MFLPLLELCVSYPRLGLFGPSFVETWDEMRNQDENNTQGKITGDQTSIFHLGSSNPSFLVLPYLRLYQCCCCAHILQ
jgi:hypothetical protein